RVLRLWGLEGQCEGTRNFLGTESLLDSLIVAGVLKEVFGRNRPDEKNPGDSWVSRVRYHSPTRYQIQQHSKLFSCIRRGTVSTVLINNAAFKFSSDKES